MKRSVSLDDDDDEDRRQQSQLTQSLHRKPPQHVSSASVLMDSRLGASFGDLPIAISPTTPDISQQRQQSQLQARTTIMQRTAAESILNLKELARKNAPASSSRVFKKTESATGQTTTTTTPAELRVQRLLREREQTKRLEEQPQQHVLSARSSAVEQYLQRDREQPDYLQRIQDPPAVVDAVRTPTTRTSPRKLLAAARASRTKQQQHNNNTTNNNNSRHLLLHESSSSPAGRRHSRMLDPTAAIPDPPPPQQQPPPPVDETKRSLHSAVAGWSTARRRRSELLVVSEKSSNDATTTTTSKATAVDQYLASRNAAKHLRNVAPSRTTTTTTSSYVGYDDDDDDNQESSVGSMESCNSSDSCSSSNDNDDDEEEWSVRVCVVSAVDFPASVVPNLPLSPVLKVGLIRPESAAASAKKTTSSGMSSSLQHSGRARVLSTTPKILSKRDNGSVEFHEELRWDGVRQPHQMAIGLELSSRAVLQPANIRESPLAVVVAQSSSSSGSGSGDLARPGKIGGLLFKRGKSADAAEMETAHAAAAVAKLLVNDNGGGGGNVTPPLSSSKSSSAAAAGKQSELDVKLRPVRNRRKRTKMTEELLLGSQTIPLSSLKLEEAMRTRKSTRIEQWYELETSTADSSAKTIISNKKPKASTTTTTSGSKRNPSILLEISFAPPEVFDDSEDDLDEDDDADSELRASYSRRASMKIRNQLKQEVSAEEKKIEEPCLQPGIIDYACVVGARDIGDQKSDDGTQGWVDTCPECVLLEQFPPNDEFHFQNNRQVALANKVEWFCFPEGVRLWRGTTPPNAEEMNLKRFSASSPPNISTSTALFDACLGCTTSFSWFVIASNSEEYGSETAKTYGAVIRFYVPAPVGIDPTQDDFAQTLIPGVGGDNVDVSDRKRLWVPLGICLTSNLPILGTMEAILLRLCEELSSKGTKSPAGVASVIREDLVDMIVRYQRPIPGVVNCSVPFPSGERFHIALPPRKGLPPLPHGNAVTSVCRLLGADGLNFLLSAFFTECKILLHSDDVSNLCLVAEVVTALMYPFQWLLPYIPVLPSEMMEFIEAPLSYLLGVPTCNMKYVDPSILDDVVVVDLDRDYSSNDVFEGRRSGMKTKTPTPLPASVASNISKAVYRLLRAEEEVEDFGNSHIGGPRASPRMEPESLAEREFRLDVVIEVCGLVRGLHDCLVYASSSSQPVFNGDKFLQTAPVMFEDQRGATASSTHGPGDSSIHSQRVISPRSRRFMSLFVNCQHFHQFLEMLENEQMYVFREVLNLTKSTGSRRDGSLTGKLLSLDKDRPVTKLSKKLQKLEDKIPTYRVTPARASGNERIDVCSVGAEGSSRFPVDLLQQIVLSEDPNDGPSGSGDGVKQIDLQYLVELEKNPWRYQPILNVDLSKNCRSHLAPERIKLRDAIGERRYRAWQIAQAQEKYDGDEMSVFSEDESRVSSVALDLTSLVTSASLDIPLGSSGDEKKRTMTNEEAQKHRITDAKDREILRRCLERRVRPSVSEIPSNSVADKKRDLVSEAEACLQNHSARRFLLAILSKRRSIEDSKRSEPSSDRRRSGHSTSVSKLDPDSFEVLVRLGCAMLDACMEKNEYDSAYALLKFTAGLYTTIGEPDGEPSLVYLTGRIGLHPVFADLGVWELVKKAHLVARHEVRQDNTAEAEEVDQETDEYEATVATLYDMVGYGIPAEELARFASRVSEENKWFRSERGQALLMLSRRLCVRRDHGEVSTQTGKQKSDLELMSSKNPSKKPNPKAEKGRNGISKSDDFGIGDRVWVETGWCHPAAKSSRRLNMTDSSSSTRRPGTQNLLNMLEEQKVPQTGPGANRMKRAAITSMAYLGSSMVATGGLDGGVFLGRKVHGDSGEMDEGAENCGVSGLHLDWGSSGSRYAVGASAGAIDGEYGVGAVSCLAATRGSQQSYQTIGANTATTKDATGPVDDEDLLRAVDGCRVVAGTTCGDLRVWSVKDVLSAVFYSKGNQSSSAASFGTPRRKGGTDFAAGSSLTRLKFSLRGRALSGHRGGVSCVDVPSSIYRPDSIVSGGADGLIKLWSLRTPGSTGRSDASPSSRLLSSPAGENPHNRAARNGDALSILSGHGGRILCVKMAWHGDRLLSGGADRIVRIWDIAGSGGRCLNSLSGHFGWVTAVRYWGPNTIISASTDRSVALWDARVRNSPLFTLRHHYAPVSDLLVGSRTDPIMVSSAMDGTVAAWDFRRLSDNAEKSRPSGVGPQDVGEKHAKFCKVSRDPVAQLYMRDFCKRRHVYGPVLLGRATRLAGNKTVYCLGSDANLREWDIQTGQIVSDHITGHCETISSFCSIQGDRLLGTQLDGTGDERATGTITASWDGTVRFRTLCKRSKR